MKKCLLIIITGFLIFAVSCTDNSTVTNIQTNETAAAKTPVSATPENTETITPAASGLEVSPGIATPVYLREFDWEKVPEGQVEPYGITDESNEELSLRRENDKYIGYKDGKKIYRLELSNKNNDIIYPTFKDTGLPSGNIYNINIAKNIGFLNKDLNKTVDEKYNDYITYTYNDDGSILTVSAGSYLFDAKGNILLDKTEYRLSENNFGYAFITDQNKYNQEYRLAGLLNLKTGKIQIPCIYEKLKFVSPEVLYTEKYVYNGDTWEQVSAYIDVNGKELKESDPKMKAVNERKINVKDENNIELYKINGKLFYMVWSNEYGKLQILDDKFDVLFSYDESVYDIYPHYGKVLFRKNNKILIYDFSSKKTSEIIINENDLETGPDPYPFITLQYSNNFFAVSVSYYDPELNVFNDPYGYYTNYTIIYNSDGRKIFPKADFAQISADGKYVWVSDDLYKGYIDSHGNWVYKEKRFTNLFD